MDPVELTRALVRIASPTGEEGEIVAFTAHLLEEAGWQVVRQPVGPPGSGRDNLYARLDPPVVVLSTHLDVVPPHLPLAEDEVWLAGRGSCDAKGIAAAMLAAAERLRAAGERRVGLLLLVGEEAGSDGARAAAELGPRGRYLVGGEPTENRLVVAHKGALRVVVSTEGRAAHSAYPAEGRSAVHQLLDALHRIRALPLPTDPLLGEATLNIGRVEGGVAANVLAPAARAELLYRLVTPADGLRAAIVEAAGPDAAVEFTVEIPPFRSSPLPGWEAEVVSFTTDLPLLASWGERYLLGPGSIHDAHTGAERVRKADLHAGADAYVRLATTLLGREAA